MDAKELGPSCKWPKLVPDPAHGAITTPTWSPFSRAIFCRSTPFELLFIAHETLSLGES